MNTLYKKKGRRYYPVGQEFLGFPCNGIWLVNNGRNSCMLRLDEIDRPCPVDRLNYRILADRFINEDLEIPVSIVSALSQFADYLADHAETEKEDLESTDT